MKRISVRIDSTDRRVLAELEKQGQKVSDIIRRALSKVQQLKRELDLLQNPRPPAFKLGIEVG